jgi:hypothetical protein
MNRPQIKKAMTEIKKFMKENNIRKIAIFNGGLTNLEYAYNRRLFELQCKLEKTP